MITIQVYVGNGSALSQDEMKEVTSRTKGIVGKHITSLMKSLDIQMVPSGAVWFTGIDVTIRAAVIPSTSNLEINPTTNRINIDATEPDIHWMW